MRARRPMCEHCGVRRVRIWRTVGGVHVGCYCRNCIEDGRAESVIRADLTAQLKAVHARWLGVFAAD